MEAVIYSIKHGLFFTQIIFHEKSVRLVLFLLFYFYFHKSKCLFGCGLIICWWKLNSFFYHFCSFFFCSFLLKRKFSTFYNERLFGNPQKQLIFIQYFLPVASQFFSCFLKEAFILLKIIHSCFFSCFTRCH